MAPLALAMFIALFAFGDRIFDWPMMTDQLQLALFASFVFGIICGYRTRGRRAGVRPARRLLRRRL